MYPQYLTDYELAVQKSLHPETPAEKRLADAYLSMQEMIRARGEDCVFCGSPTS